MQHKDRLRCNDLDHSVPSCLDVVFDGLHFANRQGSFDGRIDPSVRVRGSSWSYLVYKTQEKRQTKRHRPEQQRHHKRVDNMMAITWNLTKVRESEMAASAALYYTSADSPCRCLLILSLLLPLFLIWQEPWRCHLADDSQCYSPRTNSSRYRNSTGTGYCCNRRRHVLSGLQ